MVTLQSYPFERLVLLVSPAHSAWIRVISQSDNAGNGDTDDFSGEICDLKRDQVTRLRDALTRWLETGRVEE